MKSLDANPQVITPTFQDKFRFGNLEITVRKDFVLAASAMPEMEKDGNVLIPNKPLPFLWRAWVVSVGPGIHLPARDFTFNPGVSTGNYIYFLPHVGRFFNFQAISFVFVKMSDIDLVVEA